MICCLHGGIPSMAYLGSIEKMSYIDSEFENNSQVQYIMLRMSNEIMTSVELFVCVECLGSLF